MMSCVIRSPSFSQITRSLRELGALGVVASATSRSSSVARWTLRPDSSKRLEQLAVVAAAQEPHRRAPRYRRIRAAPPTTFTSRSHGVHGCVTRRRRRGAMLRAWNSPGPGRRRRRPAGRRARDPPRRGPRRWPAAARCACRCASSACSPSSPAHEGRIVRREDLYEHVWGTPLRHGDRTIDVYVRKLRVKLEQALPGLALHPHARRLRLPVLARAFTRLSHGRHNSITDCRRRRCEPARPT